MAVNPTLTRRQRIGQRRVLQRVPEATRRPIRSLQLLTVTAPGCLAGCGFGCSPVDPAPAALKASASLQGAGPVRLFSPWRFDVAPAMAAMAAMAAQRQAGSPTAPPPDERPLAREVVDRVFGGSGRLLRLNPRPLELRR